MTDRTEQRRELFWKQLQCANRDVQAWPEYVKQALIKPAKVDSQEVAPARGTANQAG
jgi:hypothetical protein